MYTIWLKLEDDAVGRRYHFPNVRSASFRRAHIMTCSRPQNTMYHRQVCLQRLKDSHQPSQYTQIQTKHTCNIKKRRCINRHPSCHSPTNTQQALTRHHPWEYDEVHPVLSRYHPFPFHERWGLGILLLREFEIAGEFCCCCCCCCCPVQCWCL